MNMIGNAALAWHIKCYACIPFLLPLLAFNREKYWEYEYDEVVSPNMFNFDLWITSGHADHYKDNMFHFEVEKQLFGLKPMNCPGVGSDA